MEEGSAETPAPVLSSTLTAPARLCLPHAADPEPSGAGEGSEQKENQVPGGLDALSFSMARGSTRFTLPVSPQHSTMSGGGSGSSPSSPPDPSSPNRSAGAGAAPALTPPPGSPRAGAPASADASALVASKSWVRRVQARTDELRRLFGLGPGEQLIDDFLCALKKRVLLQGRLFVFEHHLCFYSSLFGYHKVKVVPLAAVHDVAKKKNVGFPNSIQVLWDAGDGGLKKEFFTSFLSREDAYRLLLGLWARSSERGRERAAAELGPAGTDDDGEGASRGLSRRWSKWGTSKGHGTAAAAAAAAATTTDASVGGAGGAGGDRISVLDDDANSGDGTASPTDAGDGAAAAGPRGAPPFDPLSWMGRPLTPPPPEAASVLSDGEDGGDEGAAPLARASIVHGSSIREFEDGPTCDEACILREFEAASDPAPPRPDTMQRVLRCQLPTTPLGFYRAFLCPSSDFFVAFHESQGHHSIELAPWQRHYKVGPVRDLRFVTPLRGWRIGPAQALCHQTQRFRVHAGQHLVFETSQVMADIPYGDHFRVDTRWDVAPAAGGGACTLDVHIAVPFTKNTLWRKVIEKSSIDSTLEAFRMFRELADRRLAAAGGGGGDGDGDGAPGAAEGQGAATPVAASPVVAHRRTASRPSSPEEAMPATAEEWEALIAHVNPQWRGGLRALKRMQVASAANAAAGTAVSPLPGGPRHRRRASRATASASASRAGSGALDFQPFPAASQLQFGAVGAPAGPSKLAQVPEAAAEGGGARAEGALRRRAGAFLARRGPVLLLCLLFAVIVAMQAALLALAVRRAAPLAAPLGANGAGPSRLAAAREVAAIAAQLEALQRDAQAWASRHGALLGAADALAQRVGRLQAALAG